VEFVGTTALSQRSQQGAHPLEYGDDRGVVRVQTFRTDRSALKVIHRLIHRVTHSLF
jgi:hypothetical protein